MHDDSGLLTTRITKAAEVVLPGVLGVPGGSSGTDSDDAVHETDHCVAQPPQGEPLGVSAPGVAVVIGGVA